MQPMLCELYYVYLKYNVVYLCCFTWADRTWPPPDIPHASADASHWLPNTLIMALPETLSSDIDVFFLTL